MAERESRLTYLSASPKSLAYATRNCDRRSSAPTGSAQPIEGAVLHAPRLKGRRASPLTLSVRRSWARKPAPSRAGMAALRGICYLPLPTERHPRETQMLRRTSAFAIVAFVLSMLAATDATAGGQRSFVSGSGADVGTCTLTAPCRTFGYAITQTNSGGEVIVLDSAGYGPVIITQSVSIITPTGVYAGISASTGSAVTIATAGVHVVLRGLSLNGTGGTTGVSMTNGNRLSIESSVISNFWATAFSSAPRLT